MTLKVNGAWIENVVIVFLESSRNTLGGSFHEPAWGRPMIGFGNGADPPYAFYKEDIGDFHLTPLEFLRHRHPIIDGRPDELTIISCILPQTEATKYDHRRETYFPSERWARSRTRGEEVNDELCQHLVEE